MRLLSFTYLSHAIAAIVPIPLTARSFVSAPELQLGFEKV